MGAAIYPLGFNPRSPRGGATSWGSIPLSYSAAFQSTLPARGSDRATTQQMHRPSLVSIHAPREGERPDCLHSPLSFLKFQSTLPARGSDDYNQPHPAEYVSFQSTLPARGSDSCRYASIIQGKSFNPRSPRGGATCLRPACASAADDVSIHAPREGERRPTDWRARPCGGRFNPRSPRGGATTIRVATLYRPSFQSTLPARGSDAVFARARKNGRRFNPRSPRGGATLTLRTSRCN